MRERRRADELCQQARAKWRKTLVCMFTRRVRSRAERLVACCKYGSADDASMGQRLATCCTSRVMGELFLCTNGGEGACVGLSRGAAVCGSTEGRRARDAGEMGGREGERPSSVD